MNDFIDWINEQVEIRGWSFNELARRAEMTSATVSLVLSRKRNPGVAFCNGIARAFRLPPETVFRKAGLLPPVVVGNNDEQELLKYWRYLNTEDKKRVMTIVKTFYEDQVGKKEQE